MKINYTIIGIILVVIVGLLVYNYKSNDVDLPTFTIIPEQQELMEIPTDIPCSVVKDCLDFVSEQGDDASKVKVKCESTCIFLIPIIDQGVSE